MPESLPPADEPEGHHDYFVDMIEQLAERARELGEVEVAVHLQAAAEARRQRIDKQREQGPTVNLRL